MTAKSDGALLANIQALRGFAALNVVLFHCVATGATYGLPAARLGSLDKWGASGVDLFFVISGFVMVYTQHHNPKSALQFFTNRMQRIVPLYWFMTIAIFALAATVPAVFRNGGFGLDHLLLSLLFATGLDGGRPIVVVGWTLELEMLFYLVFALSLLISNRVLAATFCAACLALFAAIGSDLPLEFLFGMGCAAVFIRHRSLPIGLSAFLLGAALLLATLFMDDPKSHRVIVWGIPSALILLGAVYLPQTRSRVALYLGAASYSIYLSHIFVIPACYKVAARFHEYVDGNIVAIACTAVSGAFGCIVYEVIERNLSRGIKSARRYHAETRVATGGA